MNAIRKTGLQRIAVALLAIASSAAQAQAQWLPQWTTLWEHPEPVHTAEPLRVLVAADGAMFAVVSATHHSLSHVAVSRFNPDGSFAWTREDRGFLVGGIAIMDGGRVAIAGQNDGIVAPIYVRVYDALTGDLVWQRDAMDGHTYIDSVGNVQELAIDASGNLMVAAADNHDYVVIRFDPDGNALPTWRHTIGPRDGVAAHSIVALPDGGAVVSGQAGFIQGGYVTVRFDAQGNVVFTDVDLGGVANPLGPAFVALDADGNIVVASSPELPDQPIPQVRKLSPTGAHLWTKEVPDPNVHFETITVKGFLLAANGDPLISIDTQSGAFRLIRLDSTTGAVVRDVDAPISGSPEDMALAPNGRVLIGGFDAVSIQGHVANRMVEFDANGQPCRFVTGADRSGSMRVGAGTAGWRVLGTTPFVDGVGNDAVMYRYDADGPCTLNDNVFVNGFDGVVLP